jgi:type I restriction enzyme R subunit
VQGLIPGHVRSSGVREGHSRVVIGSPLQQGGRKVLRCQPTAEKALDLVQELYHVFYWAGRTYLRKGAENLQGRGYDESLVPRVEPANNPKSIEQLAALTTERDAAEEARKELESELEDLRERFVAIKAENEAVPDIHDWNEAKTRKLIIDVPLQRAGWPLDCTSDREYEVTGMPNQNGIGYADSLFTC